MVPKRETKGELNKGSQNQQTEKGQPTSIKNRRMETPASLQSSVPRSVWNMFEGQSLILDSLVQVHLQSREVEGLITEDNVVPLFPNDVA